MLPIFNALRASPWLQGQPSWKNRRYPEVGHLVSPFQLAHVWLPLLGFIALSALLMALHGDQWLADRVYAWEGHRWSLQDDYVVQTVLHADARAASKMAWWGMLMLWAGACLAPPRRALRRPLLYLLLSTLISTAVVASMKRWTHMDCPWDLIGYGGHKAYYGLFSARPASLPSSNCFPAGHASAGYAWVALYFFFRRVKPGLRWWGLAAGLTLGLVFGVDQQLRGAHFMSHDLWSLMACWVVALLLNHAMLRAPAPPHAAREQAA